MRLVFTVVTLMFSTQVGFAQLGYNVSVTVAPFTVDNDTFSLTMAHITLAGQDQRLLYLSFTPAATSTPQALNPISLSDVQAFTSSATTIISLANANGKPITAAGQSFPLNFNTFEVTKTPTFMLLPNNPALTSFEVQIYQPQFKPYWYRNYSLGSLTAFVSYLNTGISFLNALP